VPPRIPDDKRAAILADVRAGHKGRNQVARDHGVALSTVTKLAKEAGVTDAFDRAQTKNATAAAIVDNKAMRVLAAQRLIVKAHELLDQMDQPHTVFNFGGKDNTYEERLLPKPPTGDLRNLMVTAATAIDKHLVLERHDANDPGAMGSLLGTLLDGLQARHGTGDA
jgi:transposase-like protein